jgi:hypothetical protein
MNLTIPPVIKLLAQYIFIFFKSTKDKIIGFYGIRKKFKTVYNREKDCCLKKRISLTHHQNHVSCYANPPRHQQSVQQPYCW